MRSRHAAIARWLVLCGIIVSGNRSYAGNLDVKKVAGSCDVDNVILANETALIISDINVINGDTGDVSATASGSLTTDDGTATAEVITDAIANCNLPLSAISTLGSVDLATQRFAEAYTSDAFNFWVRAGAIIYGYGPLHASSTGLFEIQPDPLDPTVVSGVVNGLMDVIATESVNGIDTDAQYDGFIRCGRYFIEYTGLNGVTNVDIGYDDLMGPVILVSYIGGPGVNYVVTTAEVRPVWNQVPTVVEHWTYAAAAVEFTNSFAATSIVSHSSSSSMTVRGLSEDDDPAEEFLAVIVDEEVIDEFGF